MTTTGQMPYFHTVSGGRIPALGLGTFSSDHATPEEIAAAVRVAVETGYRHIDCAAVYANEKQIGAVLQELLESGTVKREELWITSKVWNDHHGRGDVLLSCAQSLKDLRLDYLDLLMIHWPVPNFHPPKCSAAMRSPDARPYSHEAFMTTYRQLERLYQSGLVRHIGVSNVTESKLKRILRDALIKPEVNEMELHPHFQQPELYAFCREHGIAIVGYCPLGSPNRPERDKVPGDTVDMADPVVVALAEKYRVHPAAICIRWGIQRGNAVIPMSVNPRNIRANYQAATQLALTEPEMAALSRIDRRCRLVKGHVFLWPGARDWHELWE